MILGTYFSIEPIIRDIGIRQADLKQPLLTISGAPFIIWFCVLNYAYTVAKNKREKGRWLPRHYTFLIPQCPLNWLTICPSVCLSDHSWADATWERKERKGSLPSLNLWVSCDLPLCPYVFLHLLMFVCTRVWLHLSRGQPVCRHAPSVCLSFPPPWS